MVKIANSKSKFASRGDDSGTHSKEKSLWAMAKIDQAASSGGWYRETGSGMGATLNAAVGMGAYALRRADGQRAARREAWYARAAARSKEEAVGAGAFF